ncbi:type IV pilus modification protein PilV [Sulfurivermis fontis]|uniref:type IV pilus modification protein PilV n=1 Tax=Sulfurivermis fontis TaxID=1972068 RepID=UPI000FD9C5C4|nr:type IV pilus modification protein PilV [Sulfurivermis fontis]
MNRKNPQAAQLGFSLMEILVTVLILAIGLLGMASLQLNALRNNSSAQERSQATVLAYEIADRMRSNRVTALAGNYDIGLGVAAVAPTDCATVVCSPAQLAGFDIWQWKADVARLLPAGDAAVSTAAGGIVTITIQWLDDRASNSTVTFTMSTVL